MSISNCPACDGKVSTSALTCPHCGHPLLTKNIARLRRPFAARLRALRSVGGFCLAVIFLSALVWFSDSALRFLALAPFGSDAQSALPLSLFTYAFVHPHLSFLFWSLISVFLAGLILETRIGSRTTLLIILGGILIPGIVWMAFGEGEALITGSSGVFYAMVGGVVALWQRLGSKLNLPERILILIIVAWAALGTISAILSPLITWTSIAGIPVGYGIALTCSPPFRAPMEDITEKGTS